VRLALVASSMGIKPKLGGTTDATAFVPYGMNAVFVLTSLPLLSGEGVKEQICASSLFIRPEE